MSIVSRILPFRPVALDPATEALELRDFGAPDLVPEQDPDAFPPDDLTDDELEALYLAELERREAARQPAQSSANDDRLHDAPAPRLPRHLDRVDALAEAEGVALDRLAEWTGERVVCTQRYVVLGRQVSTAVLYGRGPIAPRATCRKRTAVNKTGTSRGWEPGDELTTTRQRAERRARRQPERQAKRLARVAALERSDKAVMTFAQAAQVLGMFPDSIAKTVKAARIPTTRVVQGLARWKVVQREDLLRHFRRAAGL